MQNIFDGIQRPLKTIAETSGDCFIPRGVNVPALDVVKTWEFTPTDFKVLPHSRGLVFSLKATVVKCRQLPRVHHLGAPVHCAQPTTHLPA